MLTEQYCSFEVAKLLKEKGFDVPCNSCWFIGKEKNFDTSKYPLNYNEMKSDVEWLSCPTHQLAMAWLREQYKMFIELQSYGCEAGHYYAFVIYQQTYADFNDGTGIHQIPTLNKIKAKAQFKTFEEAVEESLLYVLQNLI